MTVNSLPEESQPRACTMWLAPKYCDALLGGNQVLRTAAAITVTS